MPTRKAIVVGSPGSGESQLQGVQADVNGYAAFLGSDAGGAWDPGEITVLVNPPRMVLESALAAVVDYSATIFAGHGECRSGVDGIWINDKEFFPVHAFATRARRQVTIVDSCRAVTVERFDQMESLRKMSDSTRSGYRATCRSLFDRDLSRAEEGRSIMWSCSLGQAAGESAKGGYFSQELLNSSKLWAASRSRSPASSVLSIPEAFSLANELVKAKYYPQEPSLENGRRLRSFPFSVA
jgi:hypothetical protein